MTCQHEVEAGILREANDALHEENARLKEKLTREAHWVAQLTRLEGLILAARDSEDPYGLESEALWNEADRIRAQREEVR